MLVSASCEKGSDVSVGSLKPSDLEWRKAKRSVGNGACVEVAAGLGHISIRDSKDPEGPVLSYSTETFRSFLYAAKSGIPKP